MPIEVTPAEVEFEENEEEIVAEQNGSADTVLERDDGPRFRVIVRRLSATAHNPAEDLYSQESVAEYMTQFLNAGWEVAQASSLGVDQSGAIILFVVLVRH